MRDVANLAAWRGHAAHMRDEVKDSTRPLWEAVVGEHQDLFEAVN
jgi:hypothetical protein